MRKLINVWFAMPVICTVDLEAGEVVDVFVQEEDPPFNTCTDENFEPLPENAETERALEIAERGGWWISTTVYGFPEQ
jgi:hypothetical protein